MEQLDQITLRAFLIAVNELNEPLPANMEQQLGAIADNINDHLGKLDDIADSYPPLDDIYQNIRIRYQDRTIQRNKAGLPVIDEQDNTEIINFLVAALDKPEINPESVKIAKMNMSSLIQQFIQRFKK